MRERLNDPKEKQRIYMRKYREIHLAITREQERGWRLRNPDKVKAKAKRKYLRVKQVCWEGFPRECFFCGKSPFRLALHEKHGKRHPSGGAYRGARYIQKHRDDFVPICTPCHKHVHFCMNYLHLSWKQILELYQRECLKEQ